jgi:hypothetical protein
MSTFAFDKIDEIDLPWGDAGTGVPQVVATLTKMNPQQEFLSVQQSFHDMLSELDRKRQQLEALKQAKIAAGSFPLLGGDLVKQEDDYSQAIEELEDDIDKIEFVIECMKEDYRRLYNEIHPEKLPTLRQQRQEITEEMDKMMVEQHEHYKLQKARFEECKLKYGRNHTRFFPKHDQDFISEHRGANEACIDRWLDLHGYRQSLTHEIEQLDPNDPDY